MERTISVSKEKYNRAAVTLLNCFLDMSEYELTIIVGMLNYNISQLNTKTRAELVKNLNLKPMSFNNYIKKLKDKGILQGSKNLTIHPNITSPIKDGVLSITIKSSDKNN